MSTVEKDNSLRYLDKLHKMYNREGIIIGDRLDKFSDVIDNSSTPIKD